VLKRLFDTDEYVQPLFLVVAVIGFMLPWLLVRLRERLTNRRQIWRKKRSVWLPLVVAGLAFPIVLLVVGIAVWPVVHTLPGFPWGLTDEGVFNLCALILVMPVSVLSGVIYRSMRWEKGADS